MEEAQAIAESARKLSGEKKKEPVRKPYQKPVRKTYQKGQKASTETVPLRTSETVPLSISRVGTPHLDDDDRLASPSRPHPPLKVVVDAQASADILLLNAPTTIAAARTRLAWARPVVRELTGAEAISRRNEIEDADFTPDDAALTRSSTLH
jgi:hypothetical protein